MTKDGWEEHRTSLGPGDDEVIIQTRPRKPLSPFQEALVHGPKEPINRFGPTAAERKVWSPNLPPKR